MSLIEVDLWKFFSIWSISQRSAFRWSSTSAAEGMLESPHAARQRTTIPSAPLSKSFRMGASPFLSGPCGLPVPGDVHTAARSRLEADGTEGSGSEPTVPARRSGRVLARCGTRSSALGAVATHLVRERGDADRLLDRSGEADLLEPSAGSLQRHRAQGDHRDLCRRLVPFELSQGVRAVHVGKL